MRAPAPLLPCQAGSGRRVQCLKYLVLANMLMESKVDPFDSQEARPYKSDPEVGGEWMRWLGGVWVTAGVMTGGGTHSRGGHTS